jgi:hypothetical protein
MRVNKMGEIRAPKYCSSCAIRNMRGRCGARGGRRLRPGIYVISFGLGLGTLMDEIHLDSNASNQTRPTILRIALRA